MNIGGSRYLARECTEPRELISHVSKLESAPMVEITGSDLHLVKKALAIANIAIERQPGPFQSSSDQVDIKVLLDRLIESNAELEHYARAAWIAVTGEAG